MTMSEYEEEPNTDPDAVCGQMHYVTPTEVLVCTLKHRHEGQHESEDGHVWKVE